MPDFTLAISIISAVVSTVAAFFTKKTVDAQILVSKNSALVSQTQINEQRLASDVSLLALHGISVDELAAHGLTPNQLLYVRSDLRQGEIFHRMENYKMPMVSKYKQTLLGNKHVQIAFVKFINNRLMSPSPYTSAINKFIQENLV
jgi:hypothetical protein